MPGLIDQAMQDEAAPAGPAAAPSAAVVPPIPDGAANTMSQDQSAPEADDNDPAFVGAMKYAMQALYQGDGAEGVAKSLRSAPDKVEALANTAYEIVSIVDERTEGKVPDELVGLLGMRILQEVSDIAEAAGVTMKPSDVAGALKMMILRFLGENGQDTTALEAAMGQVDMAEFDKVSGAEDESNEMGEEVPA